VAAVATGSLLLGPLTATAAERGDRPAGGQQQGADAGADDRQAQPREREGTLDEQSAQVQGEITKTLQNLDQSSARLAAAQQQLDAAQQQLDAAQDELADARGELAVAVVLDRRMQRALARAERRLAEAEAQLADGQAEMAEQRDRLGEIAVQNYQQGDPSLLGLAMVLNSEDPADLTGQLNSVQNVLDKESVTLDRLDATRVMLAVQAQEVEDAREDVARKRAAAAENLRRKRRLEERAESAQQAVEKLVSARAAARDAAAAAREADLAMLRGLQQERGRISAMLAARAEAARLQAEAAAAAAYGVAATDSSGVTGYLATPVAGYITSPYGMRVHPIYNKLRLHDGTDFGAACGTPVHASESGRVIARYFNAGYGNRVIIDHGLHRGVGLATAYNHLSGYAVSVGDRVRRGEVVGYVGSTGYSTGCHLHFMVFENGATVNPMFWL
jgi:murein DD-endopeptidase MepM/ murein hydrolase activator NlpD